MTPRLRTRRRSEDGLPSAFDGAHGSGVVVAVGRVQLARDVLVDAFSWHVKAAARLTLAHLRLVEPHVLDRHVFDLDLVVALDDLARARRVVRREGIHDDVLLDLLRVVVVEHALERLAELFRAMTLEVPSAVRERHRRDARLDDLREHGLHQVLRRVQRRQVLFEREVLAGANVDGLTAVLKHRDALLGVRDERLLADRHLSAEADEPRACLAPVVEAMRVPPAAVVGDVLGVGRTHRHTSNGPRRPVMSPSKTFASCSVVTIGRPSQYMATSHTT